MQDSIASNWMHLFGSEYIEYRSVTSARVRSTDLSEARSIGSELSCSNLIKNSSLDETPVRKDCELDNRWVLGVEPGGWLHLTPLLGLALIQVVKATHAH